MNKIEKIINFILYLIFFVLILINFFIDIGKYEIYFRKIVEIIGFYCVLILIGIKFWQNKNDKLYIYFTLWMLLILLLGIFSPS